MKNSFQHIIITRFNVPTANWEKSKNGEKVLTQEWMSQRMEIFKTITLPSFKNQVNQNYTWLVFFDNLTDDEFKEQINQIEKDFEPFQAIFVKDNNEVKSYIVQWVKDNVESEFVISSDIDNDDALHKEFVNTAQKLFQPIHDLVIDQTQGYKMIKKNGKNVIFQKYGSTSNAFVSLVEKFEEFQSVLKEKHPQYKFYSNYTSYSAQPRFIQFIHNSNKLNEAGKNRTTTKVSLKDFGIQNSVHISKKDSFIFNQNLVIEKVKNALLFHVNKNYLLSKNLYFINSKKNFKNTESPIIIYTNGKVGSSTIYESLKKNPKLSVFHVHYLNTKYLSKFEKFVRKNYFRKPNRGNYLWQSLLWRPQFVRKFVLPKTKPKYFIVWRDPIAKNISTFFEWIHFKEDEDFFYFHSHQYEMQFDIKTSKNDLQPLIDYFLQNFPHTIHEDWIISEQGETLHLPFNKYTFDTDKNYQIIENDTSKVLTLKLEHFNNPKYPKIIADFLDLPNFEFENANLTSSKPKNKAYTLFKEQIQIPEELNDRIYKSDFMKHFYSTSEIEKFKQKWSKTK